METTTPYFRKEKRVQRGELFVYDHTADLELSPKGSLCVVSTDVVIVPSGQLAWTQKNALLMV